MAFINRPTTQASYYFTVFALTPKQATAAQESTQPQPQSQPAWLPPLYVYAPFLLFFALFLGAFGIQLIGKIRSFKRITAAFIIALFAASIPLVLTQVREGTGFRSRASADEVPQNVQIAQNSRDSVYISWTTAVERIGAVRIGPAPLTEQNSTVMIGDLGNRVKNHSLKLENLNPNLEYEMEILSGTLWYTDKGEPIKLRLRGM